MTMLEKAKAAFIDRDGVINEERGYVHSVEEFVVLPGVIEGLKLLQNAGYLLVVVTNQAGLARGYYNFEKMAKLHQHLSEVLAEENVALDAIYYCPHHPQGKIPDLSINCMCRKPQPGMLLKAIQHFQIDRRASVMIGDKSSDIQAGKSAGVGCNILVRSGHMINAAGAEQADLVVDDLISAARAITCRGASSFKY